MSIVYPIKIFIFLCYNFSMNLNKVQREIKKLASPTRAGLLGRFFKTGPGQYGEGDKFLGLTVPQVRIIVKKYYQALTLPETAKLLASPYHEFRLTGALILIAKYQTAEIKNKKKFFAFYFENIKAFNNWDLVDLTAHKIVGDYLLDKDRKILFSLAKSPNLWERRVSVIASFAFINNRQFSESLKLAKILLTDCHDLVHKAVGWMLREVGKRDQPVLLKFLNQHASTMPRVMLRYALEKLPKKQRQYYLRQK